MAKKKQTRTTGSASSSLTSSSVDELLLAALERGGNTMETGRYLVTFKDGANDAALEYLSTTHGLRVADPRVAAHVGGARGVYVSDASGSRA